MADDRELDVAVTVEATADDVWAALRDPQQIRRWYGWQRDGLDEEIQRTFVDEAIADDDRYVLDLHGGDRLEIQPGGSGTRVVLSSNELSAVWVISLHQLKFVLEKQPDNMRRTLHFSGRGDPEALPRLLHAVPAEVGATWYRTGHQQGIVLPDLGPGLLITAGSPSVMRADGGTSVGALAVVTMYGVLDGEFGIQRDIWTAWWRSAYPDAGDPQY